jgi:divalent metal cation (Fe/Co/Zn/Cd) transporter
VTDQGGKLRAGEVLSAAAHAGRRDWWQFLAVAVPVSLIGAGLEIVLEDYLDPSDAPLSISATLAVTGVSILGTVLLSGFVTGLVGATEHGRERRTLAETVRSLPWKRLVVADILVTITVVIGLVLFVLPGLAALTLLAVVGPVIEIERRPVRCAFRRSVQLVSRVVNLFNNLVD